MADFSIENKCKVNTNIDLDTFVGIMCQDGEFEIHFPLGFHKSEDDKELRKDILLLMSTISSTVGRRDSEIAERAMDYSQIEFPFQAYLTVIYDFYGRGYYQEREVTFTVSKRGKIDWNRTIKTQRPYLENNNVFYLDFVTKRNSINDNEFISLIHEYCVYDAFSKVGWLFTSNIPQKPRIKYNEKLFRRVVTDKLQNTFNDKNKVLFSSMLAIINYLGDMNTNKDYRYGTYRFEYVWEALVDRIFGIENKADYYPKTSWNIDGRHYEVNESHENSSLRPDTIMVHGGDIFVLDAKYYKFGAYKAPGMLPKSTDINKQITYGEYIAEQEKFKKMHGEEFRVYNAFIMPFDSLSPLWSGSCEMRNIGSATGNWKTNTKEYENVKGILLDIKYLMKLGAWKNEDEIKKMCDVICPVIT